MKPCFSYPETSYNQGLFANTSHILLARYQIGVELINATLYYITQRAQNFYLLLDPWIRPSEFISNMNNISQKIGQMEDKVSSLYKQMEALEAEAKAFLQKSKEAKGSAKQMYKQKCLMCLQKKKAIEKQAKSYNSHQNMLQQAAFNVEAAGGHKQMYEALKGAVQTQKQAMKNIDLDKMDQLQDQMMDLKMQSDMMNQMMNRNYDMDIDEDQFQDQFMEFQKEVAIEKKKNINNPNIQKQQIKGHQFGNILQ